MTRACSLPTPAERRFHEIQAEIRDAMMRKVSAALDEATNAAQSRMREAKVELPPPSSGYFAAVIHQAMFCTLCGADPKTLEGGDPRIALRVLRNGRNIARHHWGAAIEPAS